MNGKRCCAMGCLLAMAIWVVAGCAWRLPPSAPAADLRQVLESASKLEDPRAKNAILRAALHSKVEEFQSLVERNLVLRERILREANRLEESFKHQHELVPADLKLVSEGAAQYMALRNELFALVDRYQCLMEYSEAELVQNGVDPRLRLVAVMVSVGAALTLYDNYLTTVVRFERSPGLRRYVNHGDKAAGLDRRQLEQIGQSARSIVNRGQLRGAILSYEEWKRKYPEWRNRFRPGDDAIDVLDSDFAYLETLIQSSISYQFVVGVHPARLSGMKLGTLRRTLPDLLRAGGDQLLRALTRVFVEAIALCEPRRGMLYLGDAPRPEVLQHLESALQPGDILLEKAPFRLTDRIVPGYWGHVGIWVGTPAELSGLGLWNDSRLAGLHHGRNVEVRESIAHGKRVIEAVRGGVTLNTLEHFLNVDDLAVLRPRMNGDPARRAEQAEALLTALSHLGKSYDFGFNVHTRNSIVCSELAFQSYTQPEFQWPKANVFGRYTLSPDQVAMRCLRIHDVDPPLHLIAFYHKGRRIDLPRDELESMMRQLLKVKEHEKAYDTRAAPVRSQPASAPR